MQLLKFFKSNVGLKVVMGLTGFALAAFLFIHMVGNLQVFVGENTINAYGAMLKASPEVLWGFRLGLLAVVVIHIASAIALARRNVAAKPQGYDVSNANKASWASRYMMVSGIIVLCFIVFHILHFTTLSIFPYYNTLVQHLPNGGERHNIYQMMIDGFSVPWVVAVYVIGMALVSVHLSHGVASLFRSLGLMNNVWRPLEEKISILYAVIIFCGMAVIPVALFAGVRGIDHEPSENANITQAEVMNIQPQELAQHGTGR